MLRELQVIIFYLLYSTDFSISLCALSLKCNFGAWNTAGELHDTLVPVMSGKLSRLTMARRTEQKDGKSLLFQHQKFE